MKNKILSLLFALGFVQCACATWVEFPIQQMFGRTNYLKPFRADAVHPLLTDTTNLFIGSFAAITPEGGTNPIVWLTPNDYMITFPDARTPWRISVPDSSAVLNALTLTSLNGLPTFTYTPSGLTLLQVTNAAAAIAASATEDLTNGDMVVNGQVQSLQGLFSGGDVNLANGGNVNASSGGGIRGGFLTVTGQVFAGTMVITGSVSATTFSGDLSGTTNLGSIYGTAGQQLLMIPGMAAASLRDPYGDVVSVSSNIVVLTDAGNNGFVTQATNAAVMEDAAGDQFILSQGRASLSPGAVFAGNGAGLTNIASGTATLALAVSTAVSNAFDLAGTAQAATNTPALLRTNFCRIIRPEDFGAAGNGSTDDTAAMQAAVNLACSLGSPCELRCAPSVSYKIGRIVMTNGCSIRGNATPSQALPSPAFATFLCTDSGFTCVPAMAAGGMAGIRIEGCSFYGGNIAGKSAIWLGCTNLVSGVERAVMKDLSINNFDVGIAWTNVNQGKMDGICFINCTNGFISTQPTIQGTNGAGMCDNRIERLSGNCSGYCVQLYGQDATLEDCDMGNGGGVKVGPCGSSSVITLLNCNTELGGTATGWNVFIDSGNVTIQGGSYIQSHSQASLLLTNNCIVTILNNPTFGAGGDGMNIRSYATFGYDKVVMADSFSGPTITNVGATSWSRVNRVPIVWGAMPGASETWRNNSVWRQQSGAVSSLQSCYVDSVGGFHWADSSEFDRVFNGGMVSNYYSANLNLNSVSGNGSGLTNLNIVGGNGIAVSTAAGVMKIAATNWAVSGTVPLWAAYNDSGMSQSTGNAPGPSSLNTSMQSLTIPASHYGDLYWDLPVSTPYTQIVSTVLFQNQDAVAHSYELTKATAYWYDASLNSGNGDMASSASPQLQIDVPGYNSSPNNGCPVTVVMYTNTFPLASATKRIGWNFGVSGSATNNIKIIRIDFHSSPN